MRLSRSLVACALAAVFAACSTTPTATPSTGPSDGPSGITGVVLVGPECRSPTEASPCPVPFQARLVVLDPDVVRQHLVPGEVAEPRAVRSDGAHEWRP